VTVNPGWIVVENQPVHLSIATLSLSSSVPRSGARYSLVRVDADGTVDVQDGTAVASYLELGWSDVPKVADGYAPLAVVRLYSGQTSLSKLYSSPDVFDLRFATRSNPGWMAAIANLERDFEYEIDRLNFSLDDIEQRHFGLENDLDIEISRHQLGL